MKPYHPESWITVLGLNDGVFEVTGIYKGKDIDDPGYFYEYDSLEEILWSMDEQKVLRLLKESGYR